MNEKIKELKWYNLLSVCGSVILAILAQFVLYLSKGVDMNPVFTALANPLFANVYIGYFLYIVAGVLFVFGVKNILRLETIPLKQLDVTELFNFASYNKLLLGGSVLMYLVTLLFIFVNERISFVLLLISMVLFSVNLIIKSKYSFKNLKIAYLDIIVVILFAIAGYFLYSYNLDVIPQRVFADEALLALGITNYKQNLILNTVYIPQGLMVVLQKYLCDLFGITVYAMRIYSVIFSVLSIIVFYFWVKLLFNRKMALISSVIFVFSHTFLALSKTGVHYTSGIFIMLLVLYLITLSIKQNSYLFVMLSGFVSGIGIYLFENVNGVFLIVVAYMLILAFTDKQLKKTLLIYLCIYFVSFVLTILPMIIAHANNFITLFNIAPIFSNEYNSHIQSVYKTNNPLIVLICTTLNTLQAFNVASDNSTLYGNNKSLLDFISGIFFVLGLFISFYLIKDYKFKMVLTAMIVILLFGSILKIDPPQYPELVLLIPLCALMIAYAFLCLLEVFEQYFSNARIVKPIAIILIVIFCCKIAFLNFNTYFNYYIKNDIASSSYDVPTMLGNYVNTNGEFYTIYLVSFKEDKVHFNTNLETYRFLSKGKVINEIKDAESLIPLRFKVTQDIAFIYFSYNFDKAFKLLNQAYPLGKDEVVNSVNSLPLLGMYKVTVQEVNSKQEKIMQEEAEKEKLEREKADQDKKEHEKADQKE